MVVMCQFFQTRLNSKGYYISIRGIPRDKLLDTYFDVYKRFNVVQSRIYRNGGEDGGI